MLQVELFKQKLMKVSRLINKIFEYVRGPDGDHSAWCGVADNHGVRDGLSVDGVAAPKYMPAAPNGPGPIVL